MRGNQVGRLYALVMDLARTRRGRTVGELQSRHEIPQRTVYRDLAALEAAGFPLTKGDGGRWKMVEGWQESVPFPLPAGELLALHVAADLMAPLRGLPIGRDFDKLRRRLTGCAESAQPQRSLFPGLHRVLTTPSDLAIDYAGHAAILETLQLACERRTTVRAVYDTAGRGRLSKRDLDPYALYYDPQLEALYLFAWCHLRQGVRTFAVQRFRSASATAKTFPDPKFSVRAHLRGAFRIWRGENTTVVRLRVAPSDAGWVSERKWHASQKTRQLPGGACELEFTLASTAEIRRFILQLGAAAEVLEPAALREEIAAEHAVAAALRQDTKQARRPAVPVQPLLPARSKNLPRRREGGEG